MEENSTQRNDRLLKYSAFAGTIIAAAGSANAQVVYTDIIPDSTISLPDTVYLLDLNNDATTDFWVGMNERVGTYYGGLVNYDIDAFGLVTLSSNSAIGTSATPPQPLNYAKAFVMNDVIDDAGPFFQGSTNNNPLLGAAYGQITGIISSSVMLGGFRGENNRFYGLKLLSGGNTYYGWVRVNCNDSANTFTIKDYAYESTPDQQILAGDTGNGFVGDADLDGAISGVDMMLANKELTINVRNPKATEGQLIVTNTAGQIVTNESLKKGTNRFNLDGLATGMYIIAARFNEGGVTNKFFIMK
jgi:hypothetical protein